MDASPDHRAKLSGYKRSLIRDAAHAVFARAGIEGASMRAIAAEAGVTTGAIYVHYATKEELYADLLGESLDLLDAALHAPDAPVLEAFVRYYLARPDELELALYLQGGGVRPSGLSPELDRALNAKMRRVVDRVGGTLVAAEDDDPTARRVGTAAISHAFGLLLMARTRRLAILGEGLEEHLALLLTTWRAR
jgi:AcrR family transcriptional regulator